jgi:hypothetical protein
LLIYSPEVTVFSEKLENEDKRNGSHYEQHPCHGAGVTHFVELEAISVDRQRVDRVEFSGPPPVIIKTLVKDWKEFIIPITTLKSITGLSMEELS